MSIALQLGSENSLRCVRNTIATIVVSIGALLASASICSDAYAASPAAAKTPRVVGKATSSSDSTRLVGSVPKENKALVTLGSGDVVNLQVFGRPELSMTLSVAEDGTLSAPLVGAIPVAGMSASAAAQRVAAAYRAGQYLKNPQVTLLVTQSRSQLVSVLGEVRTPGRFPVDSATTVLDLLAQAGGTTERSGSLMYVIRVNGDGNVDRRSIDLRGLHSDQYSLKLLSLQGGDSVFIPPAEQFYIYGQVQMPNMYRLEPEMTVLQAISRSGGLTKVASKSRIDIKRRDDAGQLIVRKADLNEKVQPDDIIFVKESLF